ncbi:class I SAM-dependent methyltransferase [Paenibacillus endoradicis]|uniref:class I SAM-dependent methyltransferase n=1 Tax=Paenibacillus endoradicis TaxID=2972487 RepID=UPI002159439F|nr:rRNA adenine N-6-methyltransferase family protein [Paenibacillus endoradicis]MCR8656580.1 SAM-dependent methyltransferase [Paenibacillus endoradicis]
MKAVSFLFQYIVHPKEVGAILPSSTYLGNKMIEGINFHTAKYIVEYGPGTGVFTEKLILNRDPQTKLIILENNKQFYMLLKEKYKHETNMIIINGSAENIVKYLKELDILYVDYVVSGLPFASLPVQASNNILINTQKILGKDGVFITFQYTKLKKSFIEQFFPKIKVKREIRNMPPAYIFQCTK